MTKEEAQTEIEENNLSFFVESEEYNSNVEEGHIISQTPTDNSKVKNNSIINVVISKGEESEEEKQNRINQEKAKEAISNAIEKYASQIHTANGTTVKYSSYSLYKTASDGTEVYKLKYDTSYNYENTQIYYYQLVSLDEKNQQVIKQSPFYVYRKYSYSNGKSTTTFDEYAMEYDFESIWE